MRCPSFGVYTCICQLIRFARASSHVASVVVTNSKLPNSLSKAIGVINSPKHFSNFTIDTMDLLKKYHFSLKKHL